MHWWVTPSGIAQAAGKPSGSVGPFATRAAAQAYVNAHKETAPVDNSVIGQDLSGGAKAASSAAGSVLGGFTGGLTGFHGSNFVIRAAKIIIGGMLLLIGLAHITGADNSAANIARKVPIIV